jgi:Tol biopolymer transport system component
LEEFVKLRVISLFAIIITFIAVSPVFGQADTVLGQISTSSLESFAGGISGDGRFVVFESRGNIATVNPRNEDGNSEIFLFDYAQRRIFQLTDTRSVLVDLEESPTTFSNIRVSIVNTRPVISNDGRWIAFSSNATTSTPKTPDATNPGNFNGNDYTDDKGENPLTQDGNLEMWMYQIPAYSPADLSTGEEVPYAALDTGTFIRVTNTPPSSFPTAGTEQAPPFVADDNHDASISDDGNVIAYDSTRHLIKGGKPFPAADNDEIFT